MVFFDKGRHEKGRHETRADPPFKYYSIGPEHDAEAAIMAFNATDGKTAGKKFTTKGAGGACMDWALIEQERKVEGGGLQDVGPPIPLYELP